MLETLIKFKPVLIELIKYGAAPLLMRLSKYFNNRISSIFKYMVVSRQLRYKTKQICKSHNPDLIISYLQNKKMTRIIKKFYYICKTDCWPLINWYEKSYGNICNTLQIMETINSVHLEKYLIFLIKHIWTEMVKDNNYELQFMDLDKIDKICHQLYNNNPVFGEFKKQFLNNNSLTNFLIYCDKDQIENINDPFIEMSKYIRIGMRKDIDDFIIPEPLFNSVLFGALLVNNYKFIKKNINKIVGYTSVISAVCIHNFTNGKIPELIFSHITKNNLMYDNEIKEYLEIMKENKLLKLLLKVQQCDVLEEF